MIYGEGEHLLNLLEFFRKYPDDKVHIDDYVNYCQMFYDYTEILESDYFQTHPAMAEELVLQILVSILKGDQNYHYENIAFVCREDDKILRLAPMIDHEFSTYFMFPDSMPRQMYWFEQLARSIQGDEVQLGEFDYLADIREYLPKELLETYEDDLVYVKSTETGKKYPIGIKLEKNAWVKETGWYPDTCVVGLADGLKNKDLAVKFIEEKILEE